MKYTFESGKKSTVKIKITLTQKEWADAQTMAYNKTKGKFAIPGFRKGHAPKHIIEQMYGQGVFFEEAINISKACTDGGVKAIEVTFTVYEV